MTGNFVFEESWMGPFWRVKDAFASCAEDFAPPTATAVPWPYTGFMVGESQERVIRDDQALNFHFHWINEGGMLPLINPAKVQWELDVYVEGWGGFGEGSALHHIEPYVPDMMLTHTYNVNVNLAPGAFFPATGKWPNGVYDIVSTIKLVELNTAAPPAVIRTLPMVGFSELGKLAIYQG